MNASLNNWAALASLGFAALLCGCFEGAWIQGQPCEADADCAPPVSLGGGMSLRCEGGYCGGTPSCSEAEDCRQALGITHTCANNRCVPAELSQRCSRSYPEDLFEHPERYRDAVIFGTLLDLQASDVSDEYLVNSATLAVSQYQGSKLAGPEVAIVHCNYQDGGGIDNLSESDAAAEGARFLVDTLGATAIIGPGTSQLATHVFETICGAGVESSADCARDVVMISPSATSVSLTTIDGEVKTDERPGLFWRTVANDSLMTDAIAHDLQRRGVDRYFILAQRDSYGLGIEEALREQLSGATSYLFSDADELRAQLDLVVADVSGEPGAGDVTEATYDEIVFIASETALVLEFIESAAYEGDALASLGLMFSETAAEPQLFAEASLALETLRDRIRGVRPEVPPEISYQEFTEKFSAAFPGRDATQSFYAPHTFDATWLAIYGVTWAYYQEQRVYTGTTLARGIRRLSDTSGLSFFVRETDFEYLAAQLAEGRAVNITGASGHLDYDAASEELATEVEYWTIERVDGELVFEADGAYAP